MPLWGKLWLAVILAMPLTGGLLLLAASAEEDFVVSLRLFGAVVFLGGAVIGAIVLGSVDRTIKEHEPIELRLTPNGIWARFYSGEVLEESWGSAEPPSFVPNHLRGTVQLVVKIRTQKFGWERTATREMAETAIGWYEAATRDSTTGASARP